MRIEIPTDCKKIHLLFSGGIDSTLLLYLLQKENQNKVPIKCYTMVKAGQPQTYNRCIKIVDIINSHWNQTIEIQKIPFKFIRVAVENIQALEEGIVFSACNKVVEDFEYKAVISNDSPPFRGPALNEYHSRPFIELDKRILIQQYVDEDITFLLDHTHSCGVYVDQECGECYFCAEKRWALNYVFNKT